MSVHKVYCSVCHKHVEITLAGHVYEFMDWVIHCPCEEDKAVVVKRIFDNGNEFGLFNICDLVPSVEIVQEVLKAQGRKPIEFVG